MGIPPKGFYLVNPGKPVRIIVLRLYELSGKIKPHNFFLEVGDDAGWEQTLAGFLSGDVAW